MTPCVAARGLAVMALLAVWGGVEALAAPRLMAAAQSAQAQCELPDLGRMHPAVQEQLGAAHDSVVALEAAAARDSPAEDARRQEYAEASGALGVLLLAGDYPDAAAPCFRRAQAFAPADYRWSYYLAHVAIRRGDLQEAAGWLERVLRIEPADLATIVWLVHVYVDLDRPAAAEPLLDRAQALHPQAAALLYEGGRAALAVRDYPRAVERLEAALALDTSATVIHYPLAMAYRGLGDLDRAREHLSRSGSRTGAGYAAGAAVSMADPLMAVLTTALRSPQAHRDLGIQASAREDWPEAARQFESAVEMAPENAAMRLNLGTALIRTGAARAASGQLEAAVAIDPRLAAAHYLLGTLLERSGRDADAIERFRAAATYDETLGAARLRLADALRRNGRFEEALAHYRRIGEGDQAQFGEAMALVRLGRYSEARTRLGVAMARHPEQPAFAHALARVLAAAPDERVRDGQRALDLVQALATEYKTASVAETMAMALAEVGRFPEAVEWQRFAMAIVSDASLSEVAGAMATNLTLYLRGEPCRTPWRNDEPEHNPGPAVDPMLLHPSRP
ncbi:MAG: tetratricopeptide repeat protein [Acidobacteria bacterium]|nr:tetratricopeptide repeat protein [Acidobacteriota bacterium]